MPITIDWGTRVIFIPQSYLTFVSGNVYEMDAHEFHVDLIDLQDDEEGMAFPDTHRHNSAVSLGGIVLAHVVEIINGYTITFEDGQYAVNIVGANNNISDVTNVNQVSVRTFNSAGMVISGSGVTQQDKEDIAALVLQDPTLLTVGKFVGLK